MSTLSAPWSKAFGISANAVDSVDARLPGLGLTSPLLGTFPRFELTAIDGQRVTHQTFSGRVTQVWYEDRHSVEANRPAKELFLAERATSAYLDRVGVVAVADLRELPGFLGPVAKPAIGAILRRVAADTGVTVYPDWSGEFARATGATAGGGHVLLVGPDGAIRYHWQGVLPLAEARHMITIMENLLRAESLPRAA
jgi:hypothetical protein